MPLSLAFLALPAEETFFRMARREPAELFAPKAREAYII